MSTKAVRCKLQSFSFAPGQQEYFASREKLACIRPNKNEVECM